LSNFKRHNQTPKHITNHELEKTRKKKLVPIVCQNCDKEFAFASGLSKHKKICAIKNQSDLARINADLQNQIQQMKIDHLTEKLELELKRSNEKLELKDELIKQQGAENKRMENVVKQSGSITKTTTKALAYLATKYPNAPTLQSFPKIDHDKIRGEFNSIPEMIYYTENHKTTVQHLAKVITDHFLLEDYSGRPLWTSDSSRLKFIHCTIVEKIKQWMYDENGDVFATEVLDSLIDKIRTELQQYIKDAPKKMKTAPHPKDMEMITLIQKAANRAVIKIDDGFIKNGVIRNVAPTFSLKIGHIVDKE
jgi:hypothetical protein